MIVNGGGGKHGTEGVGEVENEGEDWVVDRSEHGGEDEGKHRERI